MSGCQVFGVPVLLLGVPVDGEVVTGALLLLDATGTVDGSEGCGLGAFVVGCGALDVAGAVTGGTGWFGEPGEFAVALALAPADRLLLALALAGALAPPVALALAETVALGEAEALPEPLGAAEEPAGDPVAPVSRLPDTPPPPPVPPAGAEPPVEEPPISPTAVPTAASATSPPAASSTFRRDQPRSTEADGQGRSASARMTGRRITWVSASVTTGAGTAR